MEIEQVLGLARGQIKSLRIIRESHPNDLQLQRLVADALENLAEQVIKLTALYHYKEVKQGNGHTIPTEQINGGEQ